MKELLTEYTDRTNELLMKAWSVCAMCAAESQLTVTSVRLAQAVTTLVKYNVSQDDPVTER